MLGLNAILLILAIGYSNNLLFLFALILFSQTLFWFTDTYNYPHETPKDIQSSNCYAGELSVLSFNAENARTKELNFLINNRPYKIRHFVCDQQRFLLSLDLDKRGKYQLQKISFYDSRPYGLFAKRIEAKTSSDFYVYPRLIKNVSLHHKNEAPVESGLMDSHLKGEESFLGLNTYQGEDFKKISWKHFARTEEIFVKQGLSPVLPHIDLVLKDQPSEDDLSYMATLMNLAHKNQFAFSFKYKDLYVQPDSSFAHLQFCLERLSEC